MLGILGVGMRRLAEIYNSLGYDIYGFDVNSDSAKQHLESLGIKFIDKDFVVDKSFKKVIISSAIPENNELLKKAKSLDIQIVKRGEALSEIAKNYKSIVVAGTHGKTSTTSIISTLLSSNLSVNAYIGGEHPKNSTFLKDAKYFVIESDESDRTFLLFKPYIGVVTSIDKDHLNAYNFSFENLKNAFGEFMSNCDTLVLNGEDENIFEVSKHILKRKFFYGLWNRELDAYVDSAQFVEDGILFRANILGNLLPEIFVNVFGDKYLLNTIASLLVAKLLNVDFSRFSEVLGSFRLPKRRLEFIGKYYDVYFFDDHADHPTEVEASLSALKKHFQNNRIIAIFEPHRYTRVYTLGSEIGKPFYLSNIVVVLPIASAFETPIDGINDEQVFDWIKERNPQKVVIKASNYDEAADIVLKLLKKDDLVITLGPSKVNFVLEKILLKSGGI